MNQRRCQISQYEKLTLCGLRTRVNAFWLAFAFSLCAFLTLVFSFWVFPWLCACLFSVLLSIGSVFVPRVILFCFGRLHLGRGACLFSFDSFVLWWLTVVLEVVDGGGWWWWLCGLIFSSLSRQSQLLAIICLTWLSLFTETSHVVLTQKALGPFPFIFSIWLLSPPPSFTLFRSCTSPSELRRKSLVIS